jgi:hypothetical protein
VSSTSLLAPENKRVALVDAKSLGWELIRVKNKVDTGE